MSNDGGMGYSARVSFVVVSYRIGLDELFVSFFLLLSIPPFFKLWYFSS